MRSFLNSKVYSFLGAIGLVFLLGSISVNWAALPLDATISWTAPTLKADGSALLPTEIDFYSVQCGTATGVYNNKINVGNITQYIISNDLAVDGTYFCVVDVTGTNGLTSAKSSEVTFSLDRRIAPAAPLSLGVR